MDPWVCMNSSQKVETIGGEGGHNKKQVSIGKYDRNEMDQINWERSFSYFWGP